MIHCAQCTQSGMLSTKGQSLVHLLRVATARITGSM